MAANAPVLVAELLEALGREARPRWLAAAMRFCSRLSAADFATQHPNDDFFLRVGGTALAAGVSANRGEHGGDAGEAGFRAPATTAGPSPAAAGPRGSGVMAGCTGVRKRTRSHPTVRS